MWRHFPRQNLPLLFSPESNNMGLSLTSCWDWSENNGLLRGVLRPWAFYIPDCSQLWFTQTSRILQNPSLRPATFPAVMLSLIVELLLARENPRSQRLQTREQYTAATSPAGAWIIDPLPSLQRNGLIVVSSLASVSLVSTFSLLCFFTYRFIFWRKYYRRYIGYNQYVVLMYNLALADFLQGLGFIVSLRWITSDSLHATDPACFLQGIWLQIGDPMSGMFVLAIALHTFMHVSLGRQLKYRTFVAIIVGLWVFGVVLVVIPIAIFGRYVWVPSVAWASFIFPKIA